MKPYTILPNDVCSKFDPKDVYLLAGLYINAHYIHPKESVLKTDTTFAQLYETTGIKPSYIKSSFIPKLRKIGYVNINTYNESYMVRRNEYTLPNPKENFRIIKRCFFSNGLITPKEKGFILMLYSLCINGTFRTGFTDKKIIERLNIGKTLFYQLKKSLLEKGFVIAVEKAPVQLTSEDHYEGLVLLCPGLGDKEYTDIIKENPVEINEVKIFERLSKTA